MLIMSFPFYKDDVTVLLKIFVGGTLVVVGLLMLIPDSGISKSIMRSLTEVSIQEYKTDKDIRHNYRGYEAHQGMEKYKNWGIAKQIFGGGFGTTADVGSVKYVGMRNVPILHNGYVYILLKGGIFAIFCFAVFTLLFVIMLIRNFTNNKKEMFFSYLAIACVLVLYVNNSITTAIFNPGYVILWIVAGASLRYLIENRHSDVTLNS